MLCLYLLFVVAPLFAIYTAWTLKLEEKARPKILWTLSTHGPQYALEIGEHIHVEPELLYPVLRELERREFVTAEWHEGGPERGGRRRTLYTLTAKGRQELLKLVPARD